jgi:hypothetical protein
LSFDSESEHHVCMERAATKNKGKHFQDFIKAKFIEHKIERKQTFFFRNNGAFSEEALHALCEKLTRNQQLMRDVKGLVDKGSYSLIQDCICGFRKKPLTASPEKNPHTAPYGNSCAPRNIMATGMNAWHSDSCVCITLVACHVLTVPCDVQVTMRRNVSLCSQMPNLLL